MEVGAGICPRETVPTPLPYVFRHIRGIKALEKFLNVKAVVTIDTHTIEKKSGTEQNQTRYYITGLGEGAQKLDRISRMH